MVSYAVASSNAYDKYKELDSAITTDPSNLKLIIYLRGRYIASLQTQIKAAVNEGISASVIDGITTKLNTQLKNHRLDLKNANRDNKKGNYSIVRELGIGIKSLVNNIKYLKTAPVSDKVGARKELSKSVILNVKNVVKAPIVISTRILKTSLVATVLFAPISLGMGILHAAWTCLDSKPSPYDNVKVDKMSNGFKKLMTKLNTKMERI